MEQPNPYIEIIEQPKATALRFRYITESRKAGSIMGEHSNKTNQSYPSIKINNYSGPLVAKMFCVTEDGRLHPHKLVGQNCSIEHGVCVIVINEAIPDSIIRFSNVGIQCSKRDDIRSFLDAKKEILPDIPEPSSLNTIDLTCVRLMFKVYLGLHHLYPLDPVMSRVIYDKKHCSDLTITRLSIKSAPANGNEELFVLCHKVKKEDIQVVFSTNSWEGLGHFTSTDVFKECVVICKVPPFINPNIIEPVDVKLFLRQPSTNEIGNELTFTYKPVDPDPFKISAKRRKMADHLPASIGLPLPSSINHPPGSVPVFPEIVLHRDSEHLASNQMGADSQGPSKWPGAYSHADLMRQRYQPPPQTHHVLGPDIFGRGDKSTTIRFCNLPQSQDPNNPFSFMANQKCQHLVPLHVEEANIRNHLGRNDSDGHMISSSKVQRSGPPPKFVEVKSEINTDFDDFLSACGTNQPSIVQAKNVPSFEQRNHVAIQNAGAINLTFQDSSGLSNTCKGSFQQTPHQIICTTIQGSSNQMNQFLAPPIHNHQMHHQLIPSSQMPSLNTLPDLSLAPSGFELDENEFDFSELAFRIDENLGSLSLDDDSLLHEFLNS